MEDVTLLLNLDTSWLSLKRYPGLEGFDSRSSRSTRCCADHYGVSPARSELTLSVVAPSGTHHECLRRRAQCGFLCATGDVFSSSETVERTSVIYSPTLEMRVGTSWGAGNGQPPGA